MSLLMDAQNAKKLCSPDACRFLYKKESKNMATKTKLGESVDYPQAPQYAHNLRVAGSRLHLGRFDFRKQ